MALRWTVVAAALALGACAAMDLKQSLTEQERSAMHKVGVVSLLGDKVNGVFVGTTPLNNQHFAAPVAHWNIDAFVVAQIVQLLGQPGAHFAVGEIAHPGLDADALRADRARLLWETAQSQGFDTVVSVWPTVSENFPFFKPGYGLYDNTLLGHSHRCLYASYTVEIYDVASRRRLAWEWGGESPCHLEDEGGIAYRDGFDNFTEPQKRAILAGVQARIAQSLPYALNHLDLTPVRPAPAAR
jgi:hypothetical protein